MADGKSEDGREDSLRGSVRGAVPVAPSMSPALDAARSRQRSGRIDRRIVFVSALALGIGAASALIAQILTALIGIITNAAFYGRFSTELVSPGGGHMGPWVIGIPVVGGLVVGVMARYGSKAIRGHGIPEAMEQVLFNESKIPARITFLKPISAAIAIGTGGPFGAEGPIIATGGAIGSLVGQVLEMTADERKTLLASGAAAGMAATFGAPVSAVLLSIELLVFEYRARSLVPMALAASVATAVRVAFVGGAPAFPIADLIQPSGPALASYIVVGAIAGFASVLVTRAVYGVEDAFEKLPIHWMWWPALGAIVTGLVGYVAPRTLGVGYDNIDGILNGTIAGRAVLFLAVMKLISWLVSLGSGTSGGTLAPLFTIGGGLGAALATAVLWVAPNLPLDVRVAALVGMAAMFAGASRALLTSVVFAFEATRQPLGLLPLLGGCTAAYLVSSLLMKNTIMTEKIARRGVRVPDQYAFDFLETVLVKDRMAREVVTLRAAQTLGAARVFLAEGGPASHQGFPIVDEAGAVVGVLTRRDLLDLEASEDQTLAQLLTRSPIVAYDDETLREVADRMVVEAVGRLPVITRSEPRKLVGIVTRSDLLTAQRRRIEAARQKTRHLSIRPGARPT
jgi:H+/Cl- antiporter ClcA/CBS domain-containing protein